MDNGAIFCHVSKIMPGYNETPCVTSGTQKWKGERPNFITKASVMSIDAIGLVIFIIVHWPVYKRLIRIANIRIIDAVACVIKYFVEASIDRGL